MHLHPAPGTEIDPKSLEVTGIDLDHPFRFAKRREGGGDHGNMPVRGGEEARLPARDPVGHNAHFDLNFLNAAGAGRPQAQPVPSLQRVRHGHAGRGGLWPDRTGAAVAAAGFDWNAEDAHSAVYDAEQTALLFCTIANAWPKPLASARPATPWH